MYMIMEVLCLHILFCFMVLDADIGEGSKFQRSLSMPASPAIPLTPTTPASARKENVWRSVFHPGSNLATKRIGNQYFDKPQPNSPTVYDWYVVYITLAYLNICMLLGSALIWTGCLSTGSNCYLCEAVIISYIKYMYLTLTSRNGRFVYPIDEIQAPRGEERILCRSFYD